MARPACLVTGIVNDYRREPFRALAEAQDVEVIAWQHAGPPVPGLTVHRTTQAGAVRLAGSGRYRAVISGLGGRLALPGSYLAARARGIPFVLWATIWEHPRTPAHRLSWLPTRELYRRADAVATYGPHVSDYVRRFRPGDGVFEAPQAVEAELFPAPVPEAERAAARAELGAAGDVPAVLFVGRLEREKGVEVLIEAWRRANLPPGAVLALAGEGPLAGRLDAPGVRELGYVPRARLPALYAAADLFVLPSVRTATFVEPWGLVVNEAMHQGTPVIASDAVGAAAGGLVRDGRNGLVVPGGDADALATAIEAIATNPELRRRLGEAARSDVSPFTAGEWSVGMGRALSAAGASR
jgi:glycosyltransferase involved in cell wall biosynthesis